LFISIVSGRQILCLISLVNYEVISSYPELSLRFTKSINLEISYGSVGAKNMLNFDLFLIKLSGDILEGDMLYIHIAYQYLWGKKSPNSLAIVCG